MTKSQRCTELQLSLHIILAFIIGALIGTSLISETDQLEHSLVQKVYTTKLQYDTMNKDYGTLSERFKANFDKYKEFVYNGIEMNCVRLGNYSIDNAHNNEIPIDLMESFSKIPQIFLSINGFDYQPKLIKAEGFEETVDFSVTEVTEKQFKFVIESSDPEFFIEDFDRLNICYLAFINDATNDDEEI